MLFEVCGTAAWISGAMLGEEVLVRSIGPPRASPFHVGGTEPLRQLILTPGVTDVVNKSTHWILHSCRDVAKLTATLLVGTFG